jgi:hypothetical protein
MEDISFDAVFNALSEFVIKKMEDNFLDPSLIEIFPVDPIILVIHTQYVHSLQFQ